MRSLLEIKIANVFVKTKETEMEKCNFFGGRVDFRQLWKLETKGVGMSKNYTFVDYNFTNKSYV